MRSSPAFAVNAPLSIVCSSLVVIAIAACPAPPPKKFAPTCADAPNALRPTPHPVESTSVRLEVPTDADTFATFTGKIFGDAAHGGDRLQNAEISPGYTISVDKADRSA